MKTESPEIPACFTTSIQHIQFNKCLDQLREIIRRKTSTRVIIVTGPSGAGKSTLRAHFEAELAALSAQERATNPEIVAYGSISMKSPGPTAFSWKDPYTQMLHSLHHPFADSNFTAKSIRKYDAEHAPIKSISPEAANRLSNDRLFRIVQRTIDHRRPRAMIIDEAQHMLRLASSQSLFNQLEHLKWIADETKTPHVLFGDYDLIRLIDLSSALIRRREVVHFPRYIYDPTAPAKSLEDFAKVVAAFAQDLDPLCERSLLTEVPYLYQGCVGCVGVLRDWLFRAYSVAASKAKVTIKKSLLDEEMLVLTDREQLVDTIAAGEKYFRERSENEERYLMKLGFIEPGSSNGEQETEKKSGRKRPFTRKPHNDTVGTGQLTLGKNAA